MVSFIVFVFGLVVGSFLNSVIYRLEQGESALKGRSYCPHCKHSLSWYDLIPLLSFVLLKGKCRYCKAPISWQYPLVELATGILFVATWPDQVIHNLAGPSLIYLWVVASLLIVIFVYDLKYYLIPDKGLYTALALVLAWRALESWNAGAFDFSLALGAVPALFFLALVLASKETWMGMGDAKLVLFMGLFLGWPNILVALFFAFLAGAAVGVSLMLLKKKHLGSKVPFGPFLIAGTFLALLAGDFFVDWYLSLLVY